MEIMRVWRVCCMSGIVAASLRTSTATTTTRWRLYGALSACLRRLAGSARTSPEFSRFRVISSANYDVRTLQNPDPRVY
jgi:hypothetical protein